MKRRVATITLNPAYDLVGLSDPIELGEVNRVKTAGFHAAGKGINVAKVLKSLGVDVTVGGFLGKENQDGFQKSLVIQVLLTVFKWLKAVPVSM